MSKFDLGAGVTGPNPRIGSQVRVIARRAHRDQCGTVTEIVARQDHPYKVDGIEPWPLWFSAAELEPVHEAREPQ